MFNLNLFHGLPAKRPIPGPSVGQEVRHGRLGNVLQLQRMRAFDSVLPRRWLSPMYTLWYFGRFFPTEPSHPLRYLHPRPPPFDYHHSSDHSQTYPYKRHMGPSWPGCQLQEWAQQGLIFSLPPLTRPDISFLLSDHRSWIYPGSCWPSATPRCSYPCPSYFWLRDAASFDEMG